MTTANRIHVVEGAFTETADGARLLGSRCGSCDTVYFPRSPVCRRPGCADPGMIEDALLGPSGKLWSYTIQYYKPPPPAQFDDPFTPYALGLVDLPGGIRVMGMISCDDPQALRVGMDMELVIEILHHNDAGEEVVTWKFRPVGDRS